MKHRERKVQMTVRLSPATHKRAKQLERTTRTPLAVIVAQAAHDGLLAEPFEGPNMKAERFQQTVLNRVSALERALMQELFFIREAIGILTRVYLNHTPAVPETERPTASLSGQIRMRQAIQWVQRNAQMGVSIFDETTRARESDDVA